jgi:hypothetical protein
LREQADVAIRRVAPSRIGLPMRDLSSVSIFETALCAEIPTSQGSANGASLLLGMTMNN